MQPRSSLAESDSFHQQPTRVRYLVLTYLCLLAFILYLDRACIGQAGPNIKQDLRLTDSEFGDVLAAFTVGYGLFMAIGGRIGDRFGSRIVLVVLVVWWSAFTSLTATVTTFAVLLLVRFIFGIAEAGAFPNCARIVSRWFPIHARGFPQGMLNTTALVGAAMAHYAAALTMDLFDNELKQFFLENFGSVPIGWRWMFVVFGLLGIVWAVCFWFSYRDDPATDPRVNQAERDYIAHDQAIVESTTQVGVPWKRVLLSRNIWLIGFINTCASAGSYFYMSWFPTYLQEGRGVQPLHSGALSSMVLAGGALGSAFGGLLGDRILRLTAGRKRTRSIIGTTVMTLAAGCLVGSVQLHNDFAASLLVAVGFFSMMTMIASWWGAVNDISGRHVGVLFGLMNSLGIFGGICAQKFPGWLANQHGVKRLSGRDQWDPILYYLAGVLLIGAIAWALVNSNRSAVEESSSGKQPEILE
jgi:sugar phosphate permease